MRFSDITLLYSPDIAVNVHLGFHALACFSLVTNESPIEQPFVRDCSGLKPFLSSVNERSFLTPPVV